MSLRRTRKKQQTEDLHVEGVDDEPAVDLIYQKIKAPIVWDTVKDDFEIRDVKADDHEMILDLIKDHYLDQETLCRSIKILDDEESTEGFLDGVKQILRDDCSLMAFQKSTQTCVGCVLLRIYHQSDFGKVYSRVRFRNGEKYQLINNITQQLSKKIDLYDYYDTNIYLRINILCVNRDYFGLGLATSMISSSYTLARSLKISVIMGLISSARTQQTLKKFGMKILIEQFYVDWVNKEGEMIFDEPGNGNYTLALMAGKVPRRHRAPISDPSLTGFPPDDDEIEINENT